MSPIEDKRKLLIIYGPTATGKTELAVDLALRLGAVVISADSLQVYKYLDIGTAKPSKELRELVPHYMIDILDPRDEFNAGCFAKLAVEKIKEIPEDTNIIVAGGTFFYIRALLYGLIPVQKPDYEIRKELTKQLKEKGRKYLYRCLKQLDPASAERIHENDYVRVLRALEIFYQTGKSATELYENHSFKEARFDFFKIALEWDRGKLYENIDRRVEDMFALGFVDEVKNLREKGYDSALKPMQSIGYKQVNQYIDNEISLEEAVRITKRDTKRYAKRQITWLKKEDSIRWYNPESDLKKIINDAKRFFDN